jgi:uncharacterized OB-fold protein
MTEVEFMQGEGVGPHNFYTDEVKAAIAIVRLVKTNRRLARVILQKRLGRRRGRRIAAKLRDYRERGFCEGLSSSR